MVTKSVIIERMHDLGYTDRQIEKVLKETFDGEGNFVSQPSPYSRKNARTFNMGHAHNGGPLFCSSCGSDVPSKEASQGPKGEVYCASCTTVVMGEGTEKVKGGYENIGKAGKHSKKPMTKKKADAQRKAMFYNGYKAEEKTKNPYAVGMAAAEKETGDTPPLKKSTIVKGHKIAKAIKREESSSGIKEERQFLYPKNNTSEPIKNNQYGTIKIPKGDGKHGTDAISKQAFDTFGKDEEFIPRHNVRDSSIGPGKNGKISYCPDCGQEPCVCDNQIKEKSNPYPKTLAELKGRFVTLGEKYGQR